MHIGNYVLNCFNWEYELLRINADNSNTTASSWVPGAVVVRVPYGEDRLPRSPRW